MTARKIETREQWLEMLTETFRPRLKAAGAELPDKVRVSCGWPSKGGLGKVGGSRVLGQCWESRASAGKMPEIFISPVLSKPVDVAAVLLHELIHASKPKAKHGAEFKRSALALGLEGKMTATVPGSALKVELAQTLSKMPDYPHYELRPMVTEKKQTTRLLKVVCGDCGYVVRTTAKWIEVGTPTCPCGTQMTEVMTV